MNETGQRPQWRERWDKLTPRSRRWIVLGGGFAIALFVLWKIASFDPRSEAQRRERSPQDIGNLFGQADQRNMTLHSLQQQIDAMTSAQRETEQKLVRATAELEALRTRDREAGRAATTSTRPRPTTNAREYLEQADPEPTAREPRTRPAREAPPSREGRSQGGVERQPTQRAQPGAAPRASGGSANGSSGRQTPGSSVQRAPEIRRLSDSAPMLEEPPEPAKSGANAEDDHRKGNSTGVYVPAGSIISGVLLAGVDAPTGRGAGNGDPIPVLARVKEQAILPNRFRADVRECFIVASAVGDLGSERAYLRGEAMSCVRHDGGVIETRLGMYGVGEDGKAGMRGRLVSKQAQVISRALLAGFADGMARAFQPQRIPVLATGADQAPFQRAFGSSDAVQAGALGGMSSALDRLAQFYIRLAEQMFPVIEVDAGRDVDFVVTAGGELMLLDP